MKSVFSHAITSLPLQKEEWCSKRGKFEIDSAKQIWNWWNIYFTIQRTLRGIWTLAAASARAREFGKSPWTVAKLECCHVAFWVMVNGTWQEGGTGTGLPEGVRWETKRRLLFQFTPTRFRLQKKHHLSYRKRLMMLEGCATLGRKSGFEAS